MPVSLRLLVLPLAWSLSLAVCAQADSTVFDNLLFKALQGDMSSVLRGLDTLEDTALRPTQKRMKQTLLHRFATQDEHFVWPTPDTTLQAVMAIYHRYWTDALLNDNIQKHDSELVANVAEHLRTHVPELRHKKAKWLRSHWNGSLQDELKSHGCYAATGKTGSFYDLLLHQKETETRYPVTTPEDTLEVKVVFMDSVICNGWEGYATLDTYYPGGWATSDALYCAHDSYDLNSENFTVSYLKHEGKHFADYKRFPKLQGPDLEYRAKLVELGAADQTLYCLIRFFAQNSVNDASNPHGLANYCVIRDLSRALFDTERETDIEAWKKLPMERIHQASTALLLQNTKDLEAMGAKQVERLIH